MQDELGRQPDGPGFVEDLVESKIDLVTREQRPRGYVAETERSMLQGSKSRKAWILEGEEGT